MLVPNRYAGLIVSLALAATAQLAQATSYSVTWLQPLKGEEIGAMRISNAGHVTGESGMHAFLWKNGQIVDLDPSRPTAYTYGYDVNSSGEVVGINYTNSDAFIYRNGQLTSFSATYGKAINERGDAVGEGPLPGSPYHGIYLSRNGAVSILGAMGGAFAMAGGINNAGQIVGTSYTEQGIATAFVWKDGVKTTIPALAGRMSYGHAINDAGTVVGITTVNTNTNTKHVFLWKDGVMTDLGVDGNDNNDPMAINNAGQVIGPRFLYSNGVVKRLEDVVPAEVLNGGMVVGLQFQDINDAGQIIGSGIYYDAKFNARQKSFLLTPIGSGCQ